MLAQGLTEQTNQLTTARRRDFTPGLERVFGTGDVLLDFRSPFPMHGSDTAAIDRRVHSLIAVLVQGGIDTEAVEQVGKHVVSLILEMKNGNRKIGEASGSTNSWPETCEQTTIRRDIIPFIHAALPSARGSLEKHKA